MTDTVMELQEVWKIYRMDEFDVHALQGIDMTIKTNDFVAITGPSGCGKSTHLTFILPLQQLRIFDCP